MPHNKLIGEILVEMGLASRELIVDCLNKQMEIHRQGLEAIPLGTLLVKTGHVSMEQLEKALEKQTKNRLPS
ncbi:MAG TPA: hypothetical protein VFI02_17580 [Armatimonadota bacterium]|nr:hypothetical protein [Armatimonadota bacterium]